MELERGFTLKQGTRAKRLWLAEGGGQGLGEVWREFSQLEVLSQVLLTGQVSAVAWKELAKILIQTGTELVSRLAEPTGKRQEETRSGGQCQARRKGGKTWTGYPCWSLGHSQ